ncbi:MAG: hypothetical protein J7L46_00040 [Bacteroidales bacterium]|nr:hypothetical protein [Bacteroidales bacterium]
MKKNILTTALMIFILITGMEGKAQFTFSASPGLHLNGAAFGYKMGTIVAYGGLQIIGTSFTQTHTWTDYDINGVLQQNDNKYTVTQSLFVPSLGAKFFFKETGKLKMYGNGVFAYFIPSGKITDSDNPSANSDFKEQFKNAYFLGGQFGFGSEYFFDDNFSVGGEFGFTFLAGGYKSEYDRYIYNPNTGLSETTTETYTYKANFTPTYIKISFNFYFSGGGEE